MVPGLFSLAKTVLVRTFCKSAQQIPQDFGKYRIGPCDIIFINQMAPFVLITQFQTQTKPDPNTPAQPTPPKPILSPVHPTPFNILPQSTHPFDFTLPSQTIHCSHTTSAIPPIKLTCSPTIHPLFPLQALNSKLN